MNTKGINKITHPGNLILAGFVLAVIAMSLMVYKVMQQNLSMVTDNYYEKEATFQTQIDAEKNAASFGAEYSLALEGEKLLLKTPASIASNLDSGRVWLYCPSDIKKDRNFVLGKSPDGAYRLDPSSAAGQFIAKVSMYAAGKSYYKELKITY